MAIGTDELKAILGSVSNDCEKMELVAIGGTALSLLGMKQATKDVDLLFSYMASAYTCSWLIFGE